MDREAGYAAAHEHALTGRYREARELLERVLKEEPSHVGALVLLGKVEYYLRHASRSRRCFETALTYDPQNMTAFFGVEHYRARRRAAWSAGFAIAFAAILAGAAGLAARAAGRSVEVLRDASTRVQAATEALSQSVQEVADSLEEATGAIAEVRRAVLEQVDDSRSRLGQVTLELQRIRRDTETLALRVEELRRTVGTPGDLPPANDGMR